MEVIVPEHTQLISITDLRGTIVYANEAFCEISGYSEQELLGKPHSMVRHEDMPKEAFINLWASLKDDHAWRGLVKNRCKNGGFYWVDAYVTPLYENGSKIGYQSVRCAPNRQQVDKAELLYQKLKAGQAKRLLHRISLIRSSWIPFFCVLLVVLAGLLWLQAQTSVFVLTSILALGCGALIWRLLAVFRSLSNQALLLHANPLIQKVFCDDMTEAGAIKMTLSMLYARNRTVLGRLGDIGRTIQCSVDMADQSIRQTDNGICRQDKETDMVAAAIHQMSSATEQIARNITETSAAVVQVQQETGDGRRDLAMSVANINGLAGDVDKASQTASELEEQMVEISGVVEIINSIAEQTNLLALNAAIEAARAGDKGRGFAVVADEVRTLASRTQESTDEISSAIHQVEQSVSDMASIMRESRGHASTAVEVVEKADHAFDMVEQAINSISDRCLQVASAAEQQSSVVDETERNVIAIRDLAAENYQASKQTAKASRGLKDLVGQLESMTTAFDQ